ncbi:nucleotide-binding protein [Roseateles paludis]|uniref:Nucleotide-binding protein n=1 Tax=Roseateles paludis TaxID=3145238 RepID=A0ABV0G7I9_9BURK
MTVPDYSGYWTGAIEGTNSGGIAFEISQDGEHVSGSAKLFEPNLGQYEYIAKGTAGESLSLYLTPGRQSGGINLGNVQVVCSLKNADELIGRWKSDILTEGVLTAKRFSRDALANELPKENSVFIVHGHDEGTKHLVARFLEKLGVTPVILQEQINRGMTVIEKFEDFASRAGFAVVLMTPDDFGYAAGKEEERKFRPRQNVILELGYFVGRLGRDKTIVLVKGNIDMPSDVLGLVYEPIDSGEGWKIRVAKELKAAGFSVSLDNAI